MTGGLLVLVYAIVKAQEYGWGSGKTLGLFAVAVALLAAFVLDRAALEGAADPARHLPHRARSASSNIAMLLVASGMFSMFYFASIYVQEILGYSPLKAGFAFLPVHLRDRDRRRRWRSR